MSIEILVYLDDDQSDDSLCFNAVVYNKEDYDVNLDLNEAYEPILEEVLQGTFEFEYLDTETFEKNMYVIDSDSYEDNVNSFVDILSNFYGLTVIKKATSLHELVGVRLVGAGFRGNTSSPMLERSQYQAMHSIHGLRTSLFPANNTDYSRDDIYINKAHGSLKLTLDATKKYTEPMEFIQKVYDDIETESINPFQFNNDEETARYQSVIRSLSELCSQKRLKEVYLIIDGDEYPITKRRYLKEQFKDIYNQPVTTIGTFEGYKKSSDSFEITHSTHGKYYCHLSELSRNNPVEHARILKTLKSIDIFVDNVQIEVKGDKVKPKTININEVKVL